MAAVRDVERAVREAQPEAEAEIPTLDMTTWTDKSELFMEHPPLVAGQTRPR